MLAKVPTQIQVRILHPRSEETVPHVRIEEPITKAQNPIFKSLKKILFGGSVSILLGGGIYLVMKMVGLEFGNVETTIIILTPALLGFLTSFVLF